MTNLHSAAVPMKRNMETVLQDVRFGSRMLCKKPGFTVVILLTLTLGIGANTAIFAIIRAILFRHSDFPHSEKIVRLWEEDASKGMTHGLPSTAEFLDWRQRTHAFAQISAWRTWFCTLSGEPNPEQVWGVWTSANFFRLLGVEPALGRRFLEEEERSGQDRVVLVSHGLWQRRYGADPQLPGKTIEINGKAFTVIGVLPARFDLFGTSRSYDLWMPFFIDPATARHDDHSIMVFARVKDQFTLAQAQSEMDGVMRQLTAEHPETGPNTSVRLAQFEQEQTNRVKPLLIILALATGFVLLIACANVANLLLTLGTAREHEIATRLALGATPWRLARQLLTESVLLALAGGSAGLGLAYFGLQAARAILPTSGTLPVPYVHFIGMDASVLAVAIAGSVLTGIVFGLLPAFQITRGRAHGLETHFRSSSTGRGQRGTRALLSGSQAALSVVLLLGGGLLIRSFLKVLHEDLGFDPQNVLTMQVWLPESSYPKEALLRNFWKEAVPRVATLPGVQSASAINFLPLSGWGDSVDFDYSDHQASADHDRLRAQYRVVAPDYFGTMAMPMQQGRTLRHADNESAAPVTVISASLAQRYWPNQNPLGQMVRLDFSQADAPWRPRGRTAWVRVVGVVGEVREWEWSGPATGTFYLPYSQFPSRLARLVVRTNTRPYSLASMVKRQLWAVDKDVPISEVRSMDDFLSEAVSDRRLRAFLPGVFAWVALILAAAGIYGVMSYLAQRRTAEMGIRFALGAQTWDVLRLVMGDSARVVGWGLLAGCAGAALVARLLRGFVYGITVVDPLTWVTAVGLVAMSALLASYLPARKATSIDPMQALRHE